MQGLELKTLSEEIKPQEINENDLTYNLARFGYTEFGSQIKEGTQICLETIITSILLKGNSRKIEAIPVLLAKSLNKKTQRTPSYNLLIYLCQKHGQLEKLMGLLEELQKILPNKETEYALKVLKVLKIKPKKADAKAIKEKMRLYNAI